jgi:hypothetical protein
MSVVSPAKMASARFLQLTRKGKYYVSFLYYFDRTNHSDSLFTGLLM